MQGNSVFKQITRHYGWANEPVTTRIWWCEFGPGRERGCTSRLGPLYWVLSASNSNRTLPLLNVDKLYEISNLPKTVGDIFVTVNNEHVRSCHARIYGCSD